MLQHSYSTCADQLILLQTHHCVAGHGTDSPACCTHFTSLCRQAICHRLALHVWQQDRRRQGDIIVRGASPCTAPATHLCGNKPHFTSLFSHRADPACWVIQDGCLFAALGRAQDVNSGSSTHAEQAVAVQVAGLHQQQSLQGMKCLLYLPLAETVRFFTGCTSPQPQAPTPEGSPKATHTSLGSTESAKPPIQILLDQKQVHKVLMQLQLKVPQSQALMMNLMETIPVAAAAAILMRARVQMQRLMGRENMPLASINRPAQVADSIQSKHRPHRLQARGACPVSAAHLHTIGSPFDLA